jgi:hypothetical protein
LALLSRSSMCGSGVQRFALTSTPSGSGLRWTLSSLKPSPRISTYDDTSASNGTIGFAITNSTAKPAAKQTSAGQAYNDHTRGDV